MSTTASDEPGMDAFESSAGEHESDGGAVDIHTDDAHDMSFLHDVEVTATVELGRTHMPIREVLKLRRGSVLELDRLVGQPVDLLINQMPLARGEVIVINERFGFRISKFMTLPNRES